MNIKDEVKVTKFGDDWHKATVNILYTYNWLMKELENRAAKEGITGNQFNVLRILRGQYPKPATNNLVKTRMLTPTPDISRLIDRLELKGLVSRCKSGSDKRSVDLMITQAGLDKLAILEDTMLLKDLLPNNISRDEAVILSDLLDKLRG